MVDLTVTSFEKPRSSWALVGVFTLSIFLSALLLFTVQPMFAKLVLPLLGGSSGVWNTAMVFFQTVLLGGYIYAHLISKFCKFQTQIVIHGAVLLLGCFFLPLTIAEGWVPPEGGAQAYWLIALFAVSVGAPFFAISANAPLLQRWYSRTNDKDAEDPYFLYSASNAGSLLSLCLYPILFEPMLRLREQTELWAIGYLLLIVAIISCGIFAIKNKAEVNNKIDAPIATRSSLTLKTRLIWITLAFIPSSLMLGVTTHMTNNIASAPFLWIVPLALYLLTFILAFAKKPLIKSVYLGYMLPVAISMALLFGYFVSLNFFFDIAIGLLAYFVIALACHTRLVELRPDAAHLTEFYIWMSFGGMLGGVFNALIAPVIFSSVFEYALVLSLSVFVCFSFFSLKKDINFNKSIVIALAAAVLVFAGLSLFGVPMNYSIIAAGGILSVGLAHLVEKELTIFSSLFLLTMVLSIVVPKLAPEEIMTDRSFFGILHVKAEETEHGTLHKFIHGNTVHNYQLQDEALRKVPLAYYSKGNIFDRGLEFAEHLSAQGDVSVAMIGLGAGAMACHEKPGDDWTYFEIDAAVVDMAKNDKYFSYMSECSYSSDVRIGDARIKLNELPAGSQDIIMVDAFSSNAIPAHLVTVEALELYRSRLKPNGVVFFHTSNRLLDVDSVVATLAEKTGLDSRFTNSGSFENNPYAELEAFGTAVMVGSAEQMKALESFDNGWRRITPSPDVGLWSDDYSHILGTIKAGYKKNSIIAEPAGQAVK